jgi:hypothetical protein
MPRLLAPLVGLCLCITVAHADNWPAWRGPTGQGHTTEKNLPLKWSAKENVKWKVALEFPGNSTPVVWGEKIFLTQANKDPNPKKDEKGKADAKQRGDGKVRSLLCLSRADGKVLWQKDVQYDAFERNWSDFPYANASPATDGERVVVCFGSAGVYCYDFAGKELWKRTDLGAWDHAFGNSASPVIYGDLVIQWCGPNDGKGDNYLLGMNKKTGKTVWRHDESFGSWATPVVVKVKDQDQLVVGQSKDAKGSPEAQYGFLKGFDPKTGKELWRCQGLNSYVYTSALVGDGVAVGMSGYSGSAIAVKLGGTGDITKDRLWFQKSPANQRVGSGVIVGEHAYVVDESGIAHCYELTTGKDLWDGERVRGQTWGSMVHSDGRLYLLMKNGDTLVLAAKPKFELLATNSLGQGEQTNSSIAVSDGELYIRTYKNLYCIREKE